MITCGNHKAHGTTRAAAHHHTTVAEVRRCFAAEGYVPTLEDDLDAKYAADEAWAEGAYVRWAETRGEDLAEDMAHSPFDPIWAN